MKIQLLQPIIRHLNFRQKPNNHILNTVIHKTRPLYVHSSVKLSEKKICKIAHLLALKKGMNNRYFTFIFIGRFANYILNILHSLNNYPLSKHLKLTHLFISHLTHSLTLVSYSENMFTKSNQMCIDYIYKQNTINFYNK